MNIPSVAVATPEKCVRDSAVSEFRQRMLYAKRDLAAKLLDCFEALDSLTEAEFLDVMKCADNGTEASDLLERFRKWKGI